MIGRLWTIARREVRSLFDHPTGYVLLVVFIAANAFMFFRQAYLDGQATLRPMLDLMPWLFLFFVPAVAMRTLAEDARSGVLELVLAQPVSELELLLGKFAGAVLFLWIGLALTLPIPITLMLGAKLEWGPIVAQYVGAALLSLGMVGVGVWTSSLAKSQITAFILAVATLFVLILFGLSPLIVGLPPALGTIAARLGVLSHFENIGRGVIDLRDAVYFLSLAGVFLALAYGALLGRKLSRQGAARPRLQLGVGLAVAILVVVNLLGNYIDGRLDLTPGHAYTLSSGTKQIVGHLNDLVTIKEFASSSLPTGVSLMKQDMDDLLRDLRSASHGKIRIEAENPGDDSSAASEARSLGVEPVQFNVVGNASLQVKQGYFGLAVQYEGKRQVLPFVNETDDLEYRLASAIQSLTETRKPVVDVFNAATGPAATVQALTEELGKSYTVRMASPTDSTQPAGDVRTAVLIGSPDSVGPRTAARFAAFFKRGGSALVMASGMEPEQQEPMAAPTAVGWDAVLRPFGVSVPSSMAYDLVSNEIVPVPSAAGQALARYPFFIDARSTGTSVVNQQVPSILLTWTSPVDTTSETAWAHVPLYVSTPDAGVITGFASINPTRQFPQDSLKPQLLAVEVTPRAKADSASGRLIVVGNTDFVTDRIVGHSPQNLDFVLNAVDWLAQDDALISIRSKNRAPPKLAFTSAGTRDFVKYFNLIGVPVLVAIAGLAALARRRRRTRAPYRRLAPAGGGAA
ncbi:MAG: Gldg family protein [Gemmatimonadota bacterium]|nr:Gldg family protein [Gemmatimonadota bacterium]